jgi:Cytochrome bd terminal oxidase subunit I
MAIFPAFHIIFAVIGVALPLMMEIAEGCWLRTRNPVYPCLAKRWAKAPQFCFRSVLSQARPCHLKWDFSGHTSWARGRIGDRHAVFTGRVCILHRGDLSGDLSVRVAQNIAVGAYFLRRRGGRQRPRFCDVRLPRQWLDEHADWFPPGELVNG